MRAVEFFSGIGGWRLALGARGSIAAALDVNEAANATYALNHGEAPLPKELATWPAADLAALRADTWLLSPPCQPFCRMGLHRDVEDRRSRAFLHLMDLFDLAPPERLVLENVPGFLGSQAHDLLRERCRRHGLHHLDLEACPSRFGLPNLRLRVFVVASRRPLIPRPLPDLPAAPVGDFLDAVEDASLYLPPATLARHLLGMDLVEAHDVSTTCFIGGYGRRFVSSGSFLRTAKGVRRFSPAEVARLHGLPEGFHFPASVPLETRYKLLGNGLSIPVAAWAMDHLA